MKYIIADQLAFESKQEDESEYEGGGRASYNVAEGQEGGEGEIATATVPPASVGPAATATSGGVEETKGM